jgi:hypothetical protein
MREFRFDLCCFFHYQTLAYKLLKLQICETLFLPVDEEVKEKPEHLLFSCCSAQAYGGQRGTLFTRGRIC